MKNIDIKLVKASGSYLFDERGAQYLDLCMGYGSVALGHSNVDYIESLESQLHDLSSPGFLKSIACENAKKTLESFMPTPYSLHGFYPSGATAVEFSLKMAMQLTKKRKVISFKNSMHGKTIYASQLGSNYDYLDVIIKRLPFIDFEAEEKILSKFLTLAKSKEHAAVIIEPIQMSAGAFRASNSFYQEVSKISKEYNILLIFDEILTGCYRVGTKFIYQQINVVPDIIIIGKALANGFPVSAVLHTEDLAVTRDMNPGCTYFNHPLMCRSISSVIDLFDHFDVADNIKKIDALIVNKLGECDLKGCGALWNLNVGSEQSVNKLVDGLLHENIIVSYYGHNIRLLPNYLMRLEDLEHACNKIIQYI